MAEADIINYVRKCTAILIKKLWQLEIKLKRIEMLIDKDRNMFGFITKDWIQQFQFSHEEEARQINELDKHLDEFRDELKKLRKKNK